MADMSVPILSNGKFIGKASTDIDARVAAVQANALSAVDSKLAGKVDAVTFQQFVDSLPDQTAPNGGTGGATVTDNGDGTLTIR